MSGHKFVLFAIVAGMTCAVMAQEPASNPPATPAARPTNRGAEVVLPNTAGQIWREYDITPYTTRVGGEAPQKAAVDWVLRETGTDLWFSEPLGILNASREKLRVYHQAEVHELVAGIVERLNQNPHHPHAINLRLCTIANPNWRTQAMRILKPVAAQSPGVDAWLLAKEDASMLIGQLSRRTDYREHHSPNLMIPNGKSEVITKTRPKTYVRSVRPAGVLGLEQVRGSIDEGFRLQLSPLLSMDQRTIDAVVQCHIDQVERLVGIPVDYVTSTGTQRVQIEVPQIVSWRLHERFRWPTDQVLLLSCGVVAQPEMQAGGLKLGLPLPKLGQTQRADALLFIEVTNTPNRHDAAIRAAAAINPSGVRTRY